MSQPTLFDAPPWSRYGHPFTREPLARTSDPPTSHEAAAAYLPHAKAQQAQIHAYLRGVGPRGATSKEIGRALRYGDDGVTVARRIAEMRDAAMVSTYDGKPGKPFPDGPGHLLQDESRAPREGSCVHVAREYA